MPIKTNREQMRPVSLIIKEAKLWSKVHKSFIKLMILDMPKEKQKEFKSIMKYLKSKQK